jgi:hypothetical protein
MGDDDDGERERTMKVGRGKVCKSHAKADDVGTGKKS